MDGYTLRDLAPTDGPAIAALVAESPDTGQIRFRPIYRVDPCLALTAGPGEEMGVVVEREGRPGLVGLGMLGIGQVVIRGRPTDFALLHSLVVHPQARRQGVGGAIVAWRLARIRVQLGEDAVVVATIQKSNTGSFTAASRWAS